VTGQEADSTRTEDARIVSLEPYEVLAPTTGGGRIQIPRKVLKPTAGELMNLP
jgi:hypothetical protein